MSKSELQISPNAFEDHFDIEFLTFVAEDIKEMTKCWGARFIDDGETGVLKSSWWGIEPQITIVVNLRSGSQDICIRKSNIACGNLGSPNEDRYISLKGGQSFKNSVSGLVVPVNKLDGLLILDKDVSLYDIVNMVVIIKAEQESKGLYDQETNTMKSLPETPYIPREKLRVNEIFSEVGIAFEILPGVKEKDLLGGFDHPELLTVMADPYSGERLALIHKDHLPYHDRRSQMVNNVLLEKNLTLPDLLEGMTIAPEVFSPLFKSVKNEVDKKMGKWLEENEKKFG